MKRRMLLTIIFILFCITALILFLTLHYIDPYEKKLMGTITLIFSGIVSFTSLFTLWLYFFKKIYFRGDVYVHHILTSFRQAFLTALFFVGVFGLLSYKVLTFGTGFVYFLMLLCIEMFIKNIERKNI